jgi:exosortase
MPDPAAKTPVPTAAALALLAAGAGAVVWVLVRFWGANPEYADRFLILAAAAYAAWAARPLLAALPRRPAPAGWLPLVAGAAAFPAGWFLQAQTSFRPVVVWWLAGAWLAAAAGVVLLADGWSHLRRLAFPLGFVLFALPVPARVMGPLQHALQSATTTAAAAALPVIGIPVERTGFILSLPSGDLGVAEACSGVRSVTALTAIAAFVGYWRGFGFLRGLLLVVLSVPVIAGVNAVRVIASGVIQEQVGPAYVQGDWHEALGIAMVLLGLALVVGLAKLLGRAGGVNPPSEHAASDPAGPRGADAPRSPLRLSYATVVALAAAAAGTVAAEVGGRAAGQEVVATAPLGQVPLQIDRWRGEDLPVPEYVTEMLTYDAAVHRAYATNLGYQAHAWVIFWSSKNAVKGYHHPDVCWSNRGFRQQSRELLPIRPNGGEVPVTVREFARGHDRQLVLYWTQEGNHVWTEDDERAAQAGFAHGWLGERLFRPAPAAATGRLVVLIGTPLWGDGSAVRGQTLDFARRLAEAVYQVCPWADVGPHPH